MTLSCWIIDDEPLALNLLEAYARKTSFLEISGKFSNALMAMEALKQQAPDVIFLDIQMPDMDGMEFSKFVPSSTRIIFTTAFSEYALEGYRVNALDYLLKPISYSDFFAAAQRAQNWVELARKAEATTSTTPSQNREKAIFVKSDYRLVPVFFKNLLYIEGLKDYIKIYCENESKPIVTLMSMKSMEESLPAEDFVRVHRSYIIHKSKIECIHKNRIVIGGKEIPIGETYRPLFWQSIERNE